MTTTVGVPAGFCPLLCWLIVSVAGCSGTGSNDDAGDPGPGPTSFWPWLDDYESPGCSQPNVTCSSFVDARDGRTYRSVTIGAQTWMGTALNYGEFTDDPDAGAGGEVPKQCPLKDPAWCDRAGAEYRWHTAMALPECEADDCLAFIHAPHQGICPDGWHIPTVEETMTLLDAVGTATGPDCDTGAALKSTEGWVNAGEDDVNTDTSGLSVLPQVMTPSAGTVWVTMTGIWTASTNAQGVGVLMLGFGDDCARVDRFRSLQRTHSVRCVKD